MRTKGIVRLPSILEGARRLRTPGAMGFFGMGLLVNLASLPPRSSIATSLRDAFGPMRCRIRFSDTYVVVNRPSGPEIISPFVSESLGDALSLVDELPGRAARAVHSWSVPEIALWAPMIKRTDEVIAFVDDTSGFTPAQLAEARQLIAGDLAVAGYLRPELVAELGRGDIHRTIITPGGVMLNLAALVCGAGFINSLAWMPYGSAWRRARRLRADQCPRCRYSLVGNTCGTCPECGESLPTPAAPPPR